MVQAIKYTKILQTGGTEGNEPNQNAIRGKVKHAYLKSVIAEINPDLILQFQTCADRNYEWNGDAIHTSLYDTWYRSLHKNYEVDDDESFAIDSIMEINLEFSDDDEDLDQETVLGNVIALGDRVIMTDGIIQEADIEEIDLTDGGSVSIAATYSEHQADATASGSNSQRQPANGQWNWYCKLHENYPEK